MSSAELAAEGWSLQDGAVIRLIRAERIPVAMTGLVIVPAMTESPTCVCGTDASPVSLPSAEEGCVWIEDGEGNITDILFTDQRLTQS